MTLTIRPLTGTLGAEISGIGLGPDLSPEALDDLRDALLRHKVVFVRDQEQLDDESQVAFAQLLGPVTAATTHSKGLGGHDHTVAIDSRHLRANAWHTDATFVDRPPAISVLRAITIPAVGGDTLWADTVSAYEQLPPELQTLAERLRAVHSNQFDYMAQHLSKQGGFFQSSSYAGESTDGAFVAEHPVVRVHPETGERALLLGLLAHRIVGLDTRDSADVVAVLQRHVERPDNTVRWSWREGDVAIWDNRSTQHYAVSDYDEHRLLRRVTVAGEIPVGVDGRPSVSLAGDGESFSQVHTPPRRAWAA